MALCQRLIIGSWAVKRGVIGLALAISVLVGCGTQDRSAGTAGVALVNPGLPPAGSRTSPQVAARMLATPTVGMTPQQTAAPAFLATLQGVQSLTIEDSWWVFGPIQQVKMSFVLHRVGDQFIGTGSYAATSYYGPTTSTTRSIAIPAATIADFVRVLAAAPLREGAYTPDVTYREYSAKVQIDLATASGTISFLSQSNSEGHVPWQVLIAGRSYVIGSPQPAMALTSLDPYLLRDATIKALTVGIDATLAARRATPTPFVPVICRTPVAGQPIATPVPVPSAAPQTTRIAQGALPQIGELINLVEYFSLASTTFISIGGDLAPFSIQEPQQIASLIAALNRESTIIAQPDAARRSDIALTIDVQGKPMALLYSTTLGLLSFRVGGQNYATSAPPDFRSLWESRICSRSR